MALTTHPAASASKSRRLRMLKHRDTTVRENGGFAAPWPSAPRVSGGPRLDVFRLKIQDAAIMARGGHIGGRFIRNGREPPGSFGSIQCDHRHATNMLCAGSGVNCSTTFLSSSPGASSRCSIVCRRTFS